MLSPRSPLIVSEFQRQFLVAYSQNEMNNAEKRSENRKPGGGRQVEGAAGWGEGWRSAGCGLSYGAS